MDIDESKRKPRRTRGTPSYYYRNRFAYIILAAGVSIFGAFLFTPIYKKANEKICKQFLTPTVEEVERRALFAMPAARTSRGIKETIDSKNELMDR